MPWTEVVAGVRWRGFGYSTSTASYSANQQEATKATHQQPII